MRPTILESTPNKLLIEVSKTANQDGLAVTISQVLIEPLGVGIKVKIENKSAAPVFFPLTLSTVVIGNQQIEYHGAAQGEISSTIQPGVVQEATLVYASKARFIDVQAIESLKWILDDTTIDLILSPPAGRGQASPSNGDFNAEIFAPPSNCRSNPGRDKSVKQVLQKGDVLVDRDNPQTDSKGEKWYQEQYLGCWIHQSQLRFK